MKKRQYIIILLAWFSILLLVAGCSKKEDITLIPHLTTPIWSSSEVEAAKIEEGEPISLHEVEWDSETKPPFYTGRMPLKYKVGYHSWGFPVIRLMKPLFYDFGSFTNWFIYQGITVIGAQTRDRNGTLLAESKLCYFPTEQVKPRIEAEEIHYNAEEKPIFYCVSEIDAATGEKTKEKEMKGKKVNEYYFVWPR